MYLKIFYYTIFIYIILFVSIEENKAYSYELMAEGGYSKVKLGGTSLTGENASLRCYFYPGSSDTFMLLLGAGARAEMTHASSSDTTNGNSSSIISKYKVIQLGGDIGFKIVPTNWLNLYAVVSINISPFAAYENDIAVNGSSGQANPTVNSDYNIGASFKASINLTNNFAIGASFFLARGVADYGNSSYNGVMLSGSSGGYSILNFNAIISYLFY
ncbi:hypothetical protein [Fluviispira multicolorata]|uniref:Outer membrane protein beta-barrel domain-containing protein n=1 Tax=Fluviispira multicolorata TaxID=2654512 RepID=A0A833N670_9BACT|nr:hypothetical protein [Fluviispira multicolorata]KAB8032199.1 hypothetical protein GCL57_06010 [Fluviispira multicolorata]